MLVAISCFPFMAIEPTSSVLKEPQATPSHYFINVAVTFHLHVREKNTKIALSLRASKAVSHAVRDI